MKKIIFLIIACTLIPGCGTKKKEPSPYLRPLRSYIDYQAHKKNIIVRAKKLSFDDCKSFFGDRAKLLFKKKRRRQPIYPIQLSITNKSEHPIMLTPENISIPLTPYKDVAHRLEHNAFLQVVGGIAFALLTTGVLIAGGIFAVTSGGILTALFGGSAASISAPLLVAGLSAGVVTPFFIVIGTPIVSTMKGMQSVHKNTIIKRELKNNALQEELIVNRDQTIDVLLFVAKNHYEPHFEITLTHANGKQTIETFNVSLTQEYHE